MTFYTYMMRHHKGEDSPTGDLATDMKRDSAHFPRNNPYRFDLWFDIIYNHLLAAGACHDCLQTFSECWGEYIAYQELKKRRTKEDRSHEPAKMASAGANAERCVCCGDVIPEGRQVCPACEGGG